MDDSSDEEELYTLVCQGDLSNELDARLKSLSDVDKTLEYLYQRDDQHANLLMLAALNGYDAVLRIILSHSSNMKKLVECTGNIYGIDGNLAIGVTALWCACDRGHYTLARTLIEVAEANVDRGPGNPLLIDAVINERFDTIQFLIENDFVDVNRTRESNRPKYNSLLFAAARGQTKIVAYLLKHGAEIDYTTGTYRDTALGCAAMQGHLDTVKFLCFAGASTNMKNSNAEIPLTLAFKNGHLNIVAYLLDLTHNELSIEDIELAACSCIVPMRDVNNDQSQFVNMANLMRMIFQIRITKNAPKTIMKPVAAYNFLQECQTIQEFDQIQDDNNRLFIEALLIRERILMPRKSKTLCESLLRYGEKLIEQGAFEHCLHLWEHTFHLYQNMALETSLHRFVWIFCKMLLTNVFIPPQLFVQICRLTFEPAEQNKKNHSVKNALCLVTIAVKVLEQPTLTKLERQSIYQWINDLCRLQCTTSTGQTLLHLCVSDQTYRDINYRANEVKQVLNFPNLATTQLLLIYGNRWINVDAIDISNGDTPLHIVSQSNNTEALSIIELLINTGAHIDCWNKHNKTPIDYAKTTEIRTLLQKYQTPSLLKCLCARYIVTQEINYTLIWPAKTKLNTFIYLHGCIAKH